MQTNEKTPSGLAVTALVLGIIAFCLGWTGLLGLILGVLAVIFGIIALVKKQNKGMGVTGLVLGAVGLITAFFFTVVGIAFLGGAINSANQPAHTPNQQQAAWDMDGAFAKIENGMTKAQVEEVTGKKSEDCAVTETPNVGKTEFCNYGDVAKDPGFIAITYIQDQVSSKSKHTYD